MTKSDNSTVRIPKTTLKKVMEYEPNEPETLIDDAINFYLEVLQSDKKRALSTTIKTLDIKPSSDGVPHAPQN